MKTMLIDRIEKFLHEAEFPPTIFGRLAARDPRLVADLYAGRRVGTDLIARVEHFMNIWRAQRAQGRVTPRGDRRTRAVRAREQAR